MIVTAINGNMTDIRLWYLKRKEETKRKRLKQSDIASQMNLECNKWALSTN